MLDVHDDDKVLDEDFGLFFFFEESGGLVGVGEVEDVLLVVAVLVD